MYKLITGCKTTEEAIQRSGLHIGQLMRITDLVATGNVDGTWTVHIVGLETAAESVKPNRDRQAFCVADEEAVNA